MKRGLVYLGIVCCIAVVLGFFWRHWDSGPKIVLDSNSVDFGTLASSEKVTREIRITNRGKADLAIKDIRVSCGCTKVDLEKSIIPPGESSLLTVALTAMSGKGDKSLGMAILSNDSKIPVSKVSLKYRIAFDSPLESKQILFGRVSPDKLPIKRRVFFYEDENAKERPQKTVSIPPFIKVNYPVDKKSNGFYIEATLCEDAPSGEVLADFPISDGNGIHTLSFIGHVRGKLIANPAIANVKQEAPTEIIIRNRNEKAEDIPPTVTYDIIGKDPDGLSVEVKKSTEQKVVLSVAINQKMFSNRGKWLLGHLLVTLQNKYGKDMIAVPLVYRHVDN